MKRPIVLFVLLLAMPAAADDPEGAAAGHAAAWAIPPEGVCEPAGGLRGETAEDAPALPFKPGDTFSLERLEVLRDFIPRELWQYRERFFYEGMRLEIGPCFRDYSPPAFYEEASAAHRGTAKLTEDDGLADYVAGRPFDAADIDPAEEKAGTKWAWNMAHRYQGAGFRGEFRITDLLGRIGRAEPFEGEIFKMQLSHRADLPAPKHELKFARGKHWVAGGEFFKPFDSRNYAWRQFRDDESMVKIKRSDDLHAYLPTWRRVRRINAAEVEGLYMPSFSVGVVQNQQLGVGMGGGFGGGMGAAGGVGGGPANTLQTKRSGFEGHEVRPILYEYTRVGVRDLLAPINIENALYPEQPDGEFGPWGLSFASNRWDLRRVLMIEGKLKGKPGERGQARVVAYYDLETLHPLYYLAYDSDDEAIDIGVFAGRWSEDRPDYPRWPDDPKRLVRVIDTVGAAFANLSEQGSWRRESWDLVSVPPDEKELRHMNSVSNLSKGR